MPKSEQPAKPPQPSQQPTHQRQVEPTQQATFDTASLFIERFRVPLRTFNNALAELVAAPANSYEQRHIAGQVVAATLVLLRDAGIGDRRSG